MANFMICSDFLRSQEDLHQSISFCLLVILLIEGNSRLKQCAYSSPTRSNTLKWYFCWEVTTSATQSRECTGFTMNVKEGTTWLFGGTFVPCSTICPFLPLSTREYCACTEVYLQTSTTSRKSIRSRGQKMCLMKEYFAISYGPIQTILPDGARTREGSLLFLERTWSRNSVKSMTSISCAELIKLWKRDTNFSPRDN